MENIIEETEYKIKWSDDQDWFVGNIDIQKMLLSEIENTVALELKIIKGDRDEILVPSHNSACVSVYDSVGCIVS